jgi:beta-mannosidase
VAALFGPAADLEAYVRASQYLQAEGLRYAVESNRRRKWRCSGTLPWQFNEPWPNAVGTNAVDYFGRPKAAYWAVRRAYAPLHVSLAYPMLAWADEREFRADAWLNNSGPGRSLLNVAVTISGLDGRVLHQENLAAEAPEAAAERAGDVVWRFPTDFAEVFLVHLEVIDEEGERVAENAYLHSRSPAPIFAPLAQAPAATLAVERGEQLQLRNETRAPALLVTVEAPEDPDAQIADSWFILPPLAARELAVQAQGPLRITAWNSSEQSA